MSFINVALEEHAESEVEIEYSYFIQLTEDQLGELLSESNGCELVKFSECKLPETKLGKSRIRHYGGEDEKFELTTKVHQEDGSKLEYNDTICKHNYLAVEAAAVSKVTRIRICKPLLTAEGEEVKRKDGSPLTWEIDLYIDASKPDWRVAPTWHEWAKIELEVDRAGLEDVISLIPIKYDKLIHSDSKDPLDRLFISNLYNEGYNLIPKKVEYA